MFKMNYTPRELWFMAGFAFMFGCLVALTYHALMQDWQMERLYRMYDRTTITLHPQIDHEK